MAPLAIFAHLQPPSSSARSGSDASRRSISGLCAPEASASVLRARHFRARASRARGFKPRGFTLVEMLIVVAIIALFAALAAPSVVSQVRDQRAVKSVQTIMNMYREARARSLGRGGAVMVGYDATAVPSKFYTLESIDARRIPFPECTGTNWGPTPLTAQVATAPMLNTYYSTTDGKADVQFGATFYDTSAGAVTPSKLQVCYSPKGRVFIRTLTTGPWTPLTGRVEFTAQTLTYAGAPVGIVRKFYIGGDGTTRML